MTESLEENGLREEKVKIKFEHTLVKHLNDLEEICTTCGGTGMGVAPGVFGIQGYNHPKGILFPFRREYIMSCKHCYDGVRKRCFYCNDYITKGRTVCDCAEARAVRDMQEAKRERERFEKSEKVPYKEALEKFEMLYIEGHDRFIEPKELIEWIADRNLDLIEDGEDELDLSCLIIYGTSIHDISIDARDIISAATDEMHEDAEDRIMKHAKELQKKIDEFLTDEIKSEAKTYFIDYKFGVTLV
jgi:hypothetical protein